MGQGLGSLLTVSVCQGWLASNWARGHFHLTGTWCGRGWESRAEPETGGSGPLKAGQKYFAKAGQVRQVASRCLPKTLPTCPEGAQDEAREQRGRGKLRQGPVANPTVRGVSMPNRPRKGSCTCPSEAPEILGKHSPGRQNLISCCCCCSLRQARRDEGLHNEETIKM